MIITPINSAVYPLIVGSKDLIVGTGNGPSSYNQTTGDILSVALTGFQIDGVLGPAVTPDLKYIAIPAPITVGKGGGWTLFWYTLSSAGGGGQTATWVPLASASNISTEQVILTVIGLG